MQNIPSVTYISVSFTPASSWLLFLLLLFPCRILVLLICTLIIWLLHWSSEYWKPKILSFTSTFGFLLKSVVLSSSQKIILNSLFCVLNIGSCNAFSHAILGSGSVGFGESVTVGSCMSGCPVKRQRVLKVLGVPHHASTTYHKNELWTFVLFLR